MSEQTFLVPANSKRQGLIFGFFKPVDLVIFIIGAGLTLLLLAMPFINLDSIWNVILIMFPICVAGMLVFPIPNYHNVRTLLGEIFKFYINRRKYVWRGWCYKYEQRDEQ